MWPKLQISSWNDLLSFSLSVKPNSSFAASYYYRGQADAGWPLLPSLARELLPYKISESLALEVEQNSWREFVSHAHLHLAHHLASSSVLEQLSLMQHYQAPTRFLDWTQSLLVAAYFAVEQLADRAGAIWMFHPATIIAAQAELLGDEPDDEKERLDPENAERIYIYKRVHQTDRAVAQQGCFTYSNLLLARHDTFIDGLSSAAEADNPATATYRHLLIAPECKMEILSQLRRFNVSAGSLFPGADGLGRSIREAVRLEAVFPLIKPVFLPVPKSSDPT